MRLFSPGLITEGCVSFSRLRSVPVHGKIVVQTGEMVAADSVVGFFNPHGNTTTHNLARDLDVSPFDVHDVMLKREGEVVFKGEVIARVRGLFSRGEYVAPEEGVIERVSRYTGWVTIRGLPMPIYAGYPGIVERIATESGVYLRSQGALVQGIFGIGGCVSGPLEILPEYLHNLDTGDVYPQHEGAILVGGARATLGFLQRAARLGVKGVITGGVDKKDLDTFLGYSIGVAVTGLEPTLTVIVTEGFGSLPIRRPILDILKPLSHQVAFANGATQVRAGVIRPELFVPTGNPPVAPPLQHRLELELGADVGITRAPYFGMVGQVVSKPELLRLPTEATVLAVHVKLSTGEIKVVPVANLEPLQGGG